MIICIQRLGRHRPLGQASDVDVTETRQRRPIRADTFSDGLAVKSEHVGMDAKAGLASILERFGFRVIAPQTLPIVEVRGIEQDPGNLLAQWFPT